MITRKLRKNLDSLGGVAASMPRMAGCGINVALALLLAGCAAGTNGVQEDAASLPYDRMAERIAQALKLEKGERVMLRFDPALMPELRAKTQAALEAKGAVVTPLAYGPAEEFEKQLDESDIYIWLPTSDQAAAYLPEQMAAQVKWLDAGRGRQIHFHWGDGTRGEDGSNGEHNAAYDQVYADALEIDYAELDRQMEAAIAKLRAGEVRVTTPAGTDIRFRLGDRYVTKQNGNASKAEASLAQARIAWETELPAGAMRLAPLEESVEGTVVIPRIRFDGGAEAKGVQLTFARGVITEMTAEQGEDAVQAMLDANETLQHFREFGLGMNPKLVTPPGEKWIAYYGYGAGVVRLSLGDNIELGGKVGGGGARWFFFPNATVTAGAVTLVEAGRLQPAP